MKFTCEKDALAKEISVAQEIISSKNNTSILSNVLLEADNNTLYIKATDTKVNFETKIPVEVSVPGNITIFCDKFLGILRNLPPGDVEFEEQENDILLIKPLFKKIDFRLKTIGADRFPEFSVAGENDFFEFSQKDIIEMISQTIFAVSEDENRYSMNGICLQKNENKLVMVATDGRRLSYVSKQPETVITDFESIIIPPKALNLVKKLASGEGNISLAITDKSIFFFFDNQKISSNLIEEKFPDYQRVIPKEQKHTIAIGREDLMEALKRVSLLAEQKSRRIYFNFKSRTLTLSSEESTLGVAKEEIPCDYEGEEINFAINYFYFSDPLREMTDSTIIVEYTEEGKAITLRPAEAKDYFHVVMPMQLD
jgi:DNA polymerase-3 subunit beta